jgi:hypothetical protein
MHTAKHKNFFICGHLDIINHPIFYFIQLFHGHEDSLHFQ